MFTFLLIFGYILVCPIAFFGHLLTLYVKMNNGDMWEESVEYGCGRRHPYKFSFVENILGWGVVSLVPVANIGMVIYDIAYLIAPTVEKTENAINKWILDK